MGVLDWAPTPALNASADPNISAKDGTSFKDVPSLIRGVMAGAAALALDQGGALVSSGANNVYVVETHSGITPKPGASVTFWADRDNSAEPTLDIDGSGPRRWRGADGLSLPAGAIQRGLLYTVAWNAVPGALPEWRSVGAASGQSSAGIAADFSGTLAERSQYDGQPKGKTYLAVADTPQGPAWTLYLKRSNGFGDWSKGLPIKASPSQSTADAQAAAEAAAAQQALAAQQAMAAQAQAQAAQSQAQAAAAQQVGAAQQASIATAQAAQAASSAVEAAYLASLVGALSYDMGTLDQPSDGSTNFDFGSL